MSAAGVAVNFPGLPDYEHRTSTTDATTGRDTKTETLSDEQRTAIEGVNKATEEQKRIAGLEGQQRVKVAKAEAEGANLEVAADEAASLERNGPEVQAAEKYIKWARQHTQDEQAKLQARPSPALFADSDGWDSVRKAIGLGLAGLGDAVSTRAAIMAGHAPSGRSTVHDIIEGDLQRQRAAIEKLKDNVAMARTGLTDAVEAKRALLADINLKGAEMFKRAQLLTKANLASLKLDQASIDTSKEVAELERARADHFAEYVKGHSTSVTNRYDSAKTTTENINRTPTAGAGGGGVEADKNAANFALFKEHGQWLAENLPKLTPEEAEAINSVQAAGVALSDSPRINAALAKVGLDVESGSSSKVKAYLDHMSRANDAIGRLKSGGAINKDEDARFSGWFKPRASDSPKDREMRAQNIQSDIANMGKFVERAPKNAPPGAPPPTPEFTKARVEQARGIASDAKQPPEKRKRAREYIGEAASAGVR